MTDAELRQLVREEIARAAQSAAAGGRIRPPYVDYAGGDLRVMLADAAGVNKMRIRNSADVEVAYVNSRGRIAASELGILTDSKGNVLVDLAGNVLTVS